MKRSMSKFVAPVMFVLVLTSCAGNNVVSSVDSTLDEQTQISSNTSKFEGKENKINKGNPLAFTAEEQKKRMDQALKDLKSGKNSMNFTTPAYNDMLKVARQALDDAAANNYQTLDYRYKQIYKPAYDNLVAMNEAKKVKVILAVSDVLKSDPTTTLISSNEDAAGIIFAMFQVIVTFKPEIYNDPSTIISYVEGIDKYCKSYENKFYAKKYVALEMVNKYYKGIAQDQKDFLYQSLADVATNNTWKDSSDKLTETFSKLKSQLQASK